MGKSETETKHARIRDQNKCNTKETSRLFTKAVEILRSDEKFETPHFRGTIRHPLSYCQVTFFFLGDLNSFVLHLRLSVERGNLPFYYFVNSPNF